MTDVRPDHFAHNIILTEWLGQELELWAKMGSSGILFASSSGKAIDGRHSFGEDPTFIPPVLIRGTPNIFLWHLVMLLMPCEVIALGYVPFPIMREDLSY